MSQVFCSFIIPTMGRPSLLRALKSLTAQTDGDWNAYVMTDGVNGVWQPPNVDRRIWFAHSQVKIGGEGRGGHGGMVRNESLRAACGQWAAMLDDDDRIDPRYVSWLKEESAGTDVVVFRMRLVDGRLIPSEKRLRAGRVGISFAVRLDFQRQKNIWFVNREMEDWDVLRKCNRAGARFKVSDRVAYFVGH